MYLLLSWSIGSAPAYSITLMLELCSWRMAAKHSFRPFTPWNSDGDVVTLAMRTCTASPTHALGFVVKSSGGMAATCGWSPLNKVATLYVDMLTGIVRCGEDP